MCTDYNITLKYFIIQLQLTFNIIFVSAQRLDISITHKADTLMSLVPTWHHSYHNIIDYVPCAALYILMTVW